MSFVCYINCDILTTFQDIFWTVLTFHPAYLLEILQCFHVQHVFANVSDNKSYEKWKGQSFSEVDVWNIADKFQCHSYIVCECTECRFVNDWAVFMLQYISNTLFRNWNLISFAFKIYLNKLFMCILTDYLHILYLQFCCISVFLM